MVEIHYNTFRTEYIKAYISHFNRWCIKNVCEWPTANSSMYWSYLATNTNRIQTILNDQSTHVRYKRPISAITLKVTTLVAPLQLLILFSLSCIHFFCWHLNWSVLKKKSWVKRSVQYNILSCWWANKSICS